MCWHVAAIPDHRRRERVEATVLLKLAKSIYRATPSRRLRQLYFDGYARMVRGREAIRTIDEVRYHLDLGEMIDLALSLGQFEPRVVAAIERHCRPGMTALDVGANIGAHTLRLGRLVGNSGRVYGFEPTEFAFRKLERNLALNPELNVSIFRLALADQEARSRRISFRASWRTDGRHQDASCEVDFVRLDDWARNAGVGKVDVMKMDVDGNEFGVLAGGLELLRGSRAVLIMELVGPHFADANRNPWTLLESLGYRFSDIETGTVYSSVERMSHLIPADDAQMTTSHNILAVPDGN